jgi:hypothetical protein
MAKRKDRDTSDTKDPWRHLARGVWATVASALCLACGSSSSHQGDAGRPVGATDVFTIESDPCGRPLGEVPPNRVIDLATVGPIMKLRYEAGRVLMLGLERWILWNPNQRAQVTAANLPMIPLSNGGFTYGFVEMRGSLLVTQSAPETFELRSSADGTVTGS